MNLFRTKPITDDIHTSGQLKRCLKAMDLTLLGIGAIIGAGIFVLTGIAAATKAGPSIIYSYLLAGTACTLTALAYAELASSVGGCGSAYGYTYAGLGELPAWIIGWDLLLEYGVACSAVAIGWSGYLDDILNSFGWHIPANLLAGPFEGGIVNLPAVIIVCLISALLCIGIRESTRFNTVVVFIKLFAVALFAAIACSHFDIKNWQPFMPFGWTGVVGGAGIIFFAYIGFDAVSTAAEETIDPQKNLPRGIIASLIVCTLVYMLVAGLLTGMVSYTTLNVSSPVSDVLLRFGHHVAAGFIAVGAIAGLTTVILVMFYGLTRVMLAMSRDRLLPEFFAEVHPKTQTPVKIISLSGLFIAAISGLVPLNNIAEVVNIGTLAAFGITCAGVIALRYSQPNLPRPFKTPFAPWTPLLGILLCLYLMLSLSRITWLAFFIWTVIGVVVYFSYSQRKSLLANSN